MIQRSLHGDKYSLVSSGELQSFSMLTPWYSLVILFIEWLIIVAAVALHLYFLNPWLYVIVWLIMGSRMYALYSLLHDGVHYLIFPQRRINDLICRLFLAWPLFTELRTMRKHHLAHHKHLQTYEDPEQAHLAYKEFEFPQPLRSLIFTFLKDITGVNFLRYSFWRVRKRFLQKRKSEKSETHIREVKDPYHTYRFLYYIAIVSLVMYMGWFLHLLLLWIVPYVTVYQVLNRLRLSTEHFNLDKEKLYQTRTVKLNLVEGFFLSPHNLGYHTEHHLYPSVPFYKLPDLHRYLISKDEYQKNVIINKSYTEVVKEYAR